MTSLLNFRSITAAEFDVAWPLWRDAIAAGNTYPYAPDSTLEQGRAIWCSSEKQTYIAEQEGEVVGSFYIRPNQPELGAHVCNAGYIISAQHGGKGFGRAMAEWSLQEAIRLGYRAIQFNLVVADNIASLKIWEKLGFETIGTVPEAFRNSHKGYVDAHILYKKLVA